jgi:hypothetical protein
MDGNGPRTAASETQTIGDVVCEAGWRRRTAMVGDYACLASSPVPAAAAQPLLTPQPAMASLFWRARELVLLAVDNH